MQPVRTALYLDFDNVFSGLAKLDPRSAMRYAENPQLWVDRLASTFLNDGPRRWLILRCYMNPAGWIPHPEGDGGRLYFSKFRLFFTDAGFEVVDCPRLTHTKNGADIRLVLDAAEALHAQVHYDEFVIASGDSDMTPLLVRLRAADRRTTVVSPSDTADVLGAVSDRLIGGDEFLDLLETETAEPREDLVDTVDEDSELDGSEGGPDPAGSEVSLGAQEAQVRFRELANQRYSMATEPLNLATLAHYLRAELGSVTTTSHWFGYGTFTRALQALDLPHVRMSQHLVWDTSRHHAPAPNEAVVTRSDVPDAVARVTTILKMPTLKRESWRPIYESLAAFVGAYEFNLTEATRWARDRLVESGVEVNRHAVSFVAHGASYGGCPLYRKPPPGADEIGTAFVANVLSRADAADIDLSTQEVEAIRAWLGAPER
jgi:uncharacterized LabA/DUF88 family protein